MPLNFSKEQQVIIHMIADLGRQPGKREFNAEFISKAVAYGHTWAIEWQYGSVLGEPDPEDQVSFVADVLDMWRFIESHYSQLDDAGRAQVEATAGQFAKDPKFTGFDGNNETNLMSIAQFMVEDMGRFAEFQGRSFNSHSPKAGRYQHMLSIFSPMRKDLGERTLTGEEIGAILRHH